jgi:hypothetical protein
MQSAAVITCHKKHFEQRCAERGRTLDDSMACVTARDGEQWTIDTGHPAYPRPMTTGPGTALKSLLATIGITATPNCSCNARAAEMDARGCDWCEQHIDTVVGWLREEATKRGLPFLDAAGRLFVRRAIRNARRAAAS